ncbi:hypothetical protein B0J13DRAFT_639772 [Dactylonectria estremocensis]|uniref:MARVEL domain-containing protein n=1 Tax=Dactylonectria estremocensis TaxID=1079267 RepID=A0A9P9EIK9_9HYPO|nr:hypothetical protein B0J13DRAFT_639772 [Dactylonectria estremocensis]
MSHEHVAHKVVSVILRLTQFSSAVIVLGILSRFCYVISIAQAHADGRVIYAMVVAGISIVFTIPFCLPFDTLFLAFPFDLVLWVMWLVAFCLLETRTSTGSCSSSWYYNYWGYYWGRFWDVGSIGNVDIKTAGCSQWRATLAFSFIASFLHLLSGILGIYVFSEYLNLKTTVRNVKHQTEKITKRKDDSHVYDQAGSVENGGGTTPQSTATK